MKVKAELRGYTDKDGRRAVFIRISEHGKRRFKKTQIKLLSTQWERGRVKNHPNQRSLNEIIKKRIVEMESELINPNKYSDSEFYKYCTICLKEWNKVKSGETLRQHRSEINKIRSFAPVLKLSTITPEWLNRYKSFCFDQGNTVNTVHKNLKFVRLIVRKAIKERFIQHNPFDIFEMPRYRNPEKSYLTREQIEQIEKVSRDPELPAQIRFVATWFCISSYSGLRFGDMAQFDKKLHIINNRLILYTMKTRTPVSIPINDKLKALFEQIDYRGVNITNIHYNRILKTIGAICGLGKISAHLSRHSAAMLWANSGISQEVAAKLLGHTSLKSTNIYYHISGSRIDEELKKLQ